MITKKKCNKCKKIKSLIEFHKSANNVAGRKNQCKQCISKKAHVKNIPSKPPTWVCPECGEKVELDFLPIMDIKRWKKFACLKCKFSPYGK